MVVAPVATRQEIRNQQVALWLRVHTRHERNMAAIMRAYFSTQRARVVAALEQPGALHQPVSALIDWHKEDRELKAAARRALLPAMMAGAAAELARLKPPKEPAKNWPAKKLAVDGLADTHLNIPPAVLARIQDTLTESLDQPYWDGVNAITRDVIQEEITLGLRDGVSQADIVKTIADRPEFDEARAIRVARSETTGALNGGHAASREQLISEGLLITVEWSAVLDGATREDHAALDGEQIPANEMFNLGGERCPYPGFYGLSPGQKVNCRCVVIGGQTFADSNEE